MSNQFSPKRQQEIAKVMRDGRIETICDHRVIAVQQGRILLTHDFASDLCCCEPRHWTAKLERPVNDRFFENIHSRIHSSEKNAPVNCSCVSCHWCKKKIRRDRFAKHIDPCIAHICDGYYFVNIVASMVRRELEERRLAAQKKPKLRIAS